ncbi:hypothetical protein H4R35_002451 [Dimargaris xerosporica]|nr:hypothetical protein H4R35_002451 [Dimargaris xerosporica]
MPHFSTLYAVAKACDNYEYPAPTRASAEPPVPFTLLTAGSQASECTLGWIDTRYVAPLRVVIDAYPEDERPLVFVTNTVGSAPHIVKVQVSPHLAYPSEQSAAMTALVHAMRHSKLFAPLTGWRNELYPVYSRAPQDTISQLAFTLERAATPIFGVPTLGVHINGYTRAPDGSLLMWVAKRSATKPTFPGMLDNVVAGGIAYGDGVLATVIKECEEEASIPRSMAQRAVPVGAVSYTIETVNGIQPETQFVYDLLLPADYPLQPNDGEAESFTLMTMDQVKEQLLAGSFKPNCALVALDFLVRHAVLCPDTEPQYLDLLTCMHRTLPLPNPVLLP